MRLKVTNKKRFILMLIVAGVLFSVGIILGLNGYFGGGGSIPSDTFTRGLVGYWSFEEGSGQTAYDLSNYSNNGRLGSTTASDVGDPKWTGGKIGGSLEFDGSNDYVRIEDFGPNNNFTVEAWVWRNSADSNSGYIGVVSKWTVGFGSEDEWDMGLDDGGYTYWVRTGDGASTGMTAGTFPKQQWVHQVMTYDGFNFIGYANGLVIATTTKIGTVNNGSLPILIGANADGDEPFNGKVDEVRIYNRALSAAEIRYHYNGGGPVAHWKFDEGNGTTAYDSTDNNSDGTLYGGIATSTSGSSGWKAGKYGTALAFDGVNDYVDIGDINEDIKTISFWFKSNSTNKKILDLDGGTRYLETYGNGYIRAQGFSTSTTNIYVDSIKGAPQTKNPITMLQDWIEVDDNSTFASWYQVDLDNYVAVPSGVTGAVVFIRNTYGGARNAGVQNKNSSDDFIMGMTEYAEEMTIVSLDSTHIFEAYVQDTYVEVWLAGWLYGSETVRFDNFNGAGAENRRFDDELTNRNGAWNEINVTNYGVPSGADVVFVLLTGSDGSSHPRIFGIRAASSTDTHATTSAPTYSRESIKLSAVGANDIMEVYANDSSYPATAYIIGYLKDPAITTYTSQIDYGASASWSWQTTNVTDPPSGEGSYTFIGIIISGISMRHADSSQTFGVSGSASGNSVLMGLNKSRQFDQYNANLSSGKPYLAAYSIPSTAISNYNTLVSINQWHHIVITTDTAIDANNVDLGRVGSDYFGGAIDDVRFYDYVRTPDEIRLDYNAGFGAYFGPNSSCDDDPGACITNSLVGYWNFEEGSGQTAYDNSDFKNTGTLGTSGVLGTDDPQWTKSKIGSALDLDGVNDFFQVPSSTSLDVWSNLTILAWVYPHDVSTDDWGNLIIHKGEAASGSGYNFKIGRVTEGKLGVYQSGWKESDGTINVNEWSQVGFTLDGKNIIFYINGIQSGISAAGALASGAGFDLQIGKDDNDVAFFDGIIDEVRIYNRVLSVAEIRYHYNRGGPIAQWKFDEGSGSIAYDSTENNNDGTLYGGIATSTAETSGWKAGKYGTALAFDGVNDYVQATVSQSTTTVSFWMQNNGTWQHVANSNGNYYINGVKTATAPTPYPIYFSGTTVQIGKTAASTYFTGLIDDVRIYNYARTPDEIQLDYNAGLGAHFGPQSSCDDDPGACITNGLVGYWNFEEGTGQTAYDNSDFHNNCTLGSSGSTDSADPQWAQGKVGGALLFDGTSDSASVTDSESLDLTSQLTISLWIKPVVPFGDDYTRFIEKSYSTAYFFGSGNGSGRDLSLWLANTGVIDTAEILTSNEWQHVAVTWRASGGAVIYRNGISVGTGSFTTSLTPNTSNLKIGTRGSDMFFSGTMDELRIYNRALSAAEIRYHYNRGGPVAQWRLDEGSGSTTYDSTNNNYDGTLYGGVATSTSADFGWKAGKYGTALSFDGVNDYVKSNSSLSAIASSSSYSLWFKSNDGIYSSDEYLFTQGTNDPAVYLESTDSKVKVMAEAADRLSSVKTVNDNNWHHVEFTVDGTILKLYLDGVLESQANYTQFSSANSNFYVASSATPGSYFGGLIDDVRVYNYARTPAQVLQDYNAGLSAYFK